MSDTTGSQQRQRPHIQWLQADEWHQGLHRLQAALTKADPGLFEEVPLLDSHLTPCDLKLDELEPFEDLKAGKNYFADLARRAHDPSLRRDALSIAALCGAIQSPQPSFIRLVKNVLGATIEIPTTQQLEAACHRAEVAFFRAFPRLKGQPYNADTIREGLAGYREPLLTDEPTIRGRVNKVLSLLRSSSQTRPLPTWDLAFFDSPAPMAAQVTVVEGKIVLAFNTGFKTETWPGLLGDTTDHETAHIVQLDEMLNMLKEGKLSPHLQYFPLFGPIGLVAELGAEGLPHLPGLPSAAGSDDPVQHWRATSWHALMLATTQVLVSMDRQDYTLEAALSFVDQRVPDPSNKQFLELIFGAAANSRVAGRLLFAPYAWAAYVLDKAGLNGTAQTVVEAAMWQPLTPPEFEALAGGLEASGQLASLSA